MLPIPLFALALSVQPMAYDARLIHQVVGNLPIIISAPHGGRTPINGAARRVPNADLKIVTVNDTNTDELALKIVEALEKKLKAKPYAIVAHFERKYADVNRDAQIGYASVAAKPYYEAYHEFLKTSCATVQREWGRGLLIDIHGQKADAGTVYRGTNNGGTVKHLLNRFGREALVGPKSIFGQLATADRKVYPANDDATTLEQRGYNGGFIVATYGSKLGGSIDAIQLETGGRDRTKKTLDTTAEEYANAIAIFAREYLPEKKR